MKAGPLFLIGPRGVGKSVVGRLLADRLSWALVDSDQVIVNSKGLSIAEIFERYGEEYFRELETEFLSKRRAGSKEVISLGGGAVVRQQNQQLIAKCGKVVLLMASLGTLVDRVSQDPNSAATRPALSQATGDSLLDQTQSILNDRLPVYETMADLRIDTSSMEVSQVVAMIENYLTAESFGQTRTP